MENRENVECKKSSSAPSTILIFDFMTQTGPTLKTGRITPG